MDPPTGECPLPIAFVTSTQNFASVEPVTGGGRLCIITSYLPTDVGSNAAHVIHMCPSLMYKSAGEPSVNQFVTQYYGFVEYIHRRGTCNHSHYMLSGHGAHVLAMSGLRGRRHVRCCNAEVSVDEPRCHFCGFHRMRGRQVRLG